MCGVGRTFEFLGEQGLHDVAELAAEAEKRGLGLIPGNEAGGITAGRQVLVDVDARRAGKARGRNVDGDEHRSALRVGHGRAVVEGRIFVAEARLHYLKALCLKCAPNLRDELQDHIAFANAAGAARSGVRATMRGVQNHGVQHVVLNIGREGVLRRRRRSRLCCPFGSIERADAMRRRDHLPEQDGC